MTPSQYGRLMENLAENLWTAQSGGRLVTYLPVLDSHAVDRAVAPGGGPPLFLQVKAHHRARPGDRLAFAIPTTDVGAYDRWHAVLLEGDEPATIREVYVVPGPELLRHGARGTLVDGRPCVRVTLSPTSPTWSRWCVPPARLGARLEELATPATPAPPELLAPAPAPVRSQEEGAFFEESVVAALLLHGPELAPYRPAVDLGRDLLVQRTGTPRALYLQVKGTHRQDRPGLARFQVRRRAFAPDPDLAFLFCYAQAGVLGPLWLVPAGELAAGAAPGDPEHLSFEAHIQGPDPRWQAHRMALSELGGRLLKTLGG